ncbi:hypothetical protein TRVA0_007S02410 [Trichomonascus vanleenenianus]|uniref:glycoside hydrolase family 125 protein n=1 Tax=Trichomonascus vanleenenianus TaxID=2268995 RepID=UPI003ECB5CFB
MDAVTERVTEMAQLSKEIIFHAAVALLALSSSLISGVSAFPFLCRRDNFPLPTCDAYTNYAGQVHEPRSDGPLRLPFQRPPEECRTFKSDLVEKVIDTFKQRLADPDVARLFENCYPSTLDTTVRWHVKDSTQGGGPRSFIITGDINAEWLRDSRNQVQNYQALAKYDQGIDVLLEGAIHTQAELVTQYPYCNAFQPPPESGLSPTNNGQGDIVTPPYDPKVVFECKYELDSLANFLGLAVDYYEATGKTSFVNANYLKAVETALQTMKDMQMSTYDDYGNVQASPYTFQRETRIGTETLSLAGAGNPVNSGTNLIRSAFRPSDDATIFQFLVPANALAAVELQRVAKLLDQSGNHGLAREAESLGKAVEQGVWKYGTIEHPTFGKVFAYEVDGYGSCNIMDDANNPSLLSMADFGFVGKTDPVYQNTRRMILSKKGNPYYLQGKHFNGIGGPHIGTHYAWPMSHIIQMRTTDDEREIVEQLEAVKNSTSGLGLMHESVKVDDSRGAAYTRPWFAWANTEFAKTILLLAHEKPHLIFKDAKAFSIDQIAGQ